MEAAKRLKFYLVWIFTLAGAVLGLLCWLTLLPQFEAGMRLELIPSAALQADMLGLEEQKTLLEKTRELIKSQAVLDRLLRHPRINEIFSAELRHPISTTRLKDLLSKASNKMGINAIEVATSLSQPTAVTLSSPDELRERLQKSVATKITSTSFTLNLTITDKSPLLAETVSKILPEIATDVLRENSKRHQPDNGLQWTLDKSDEDVSLAKLNVEKLQTAVESWRQRKIRLGIFASLLDNPEQIWPAGIADAELNKLRDQLISERSQNNSMTPDRGWAKLKLTQKIKERRDLERLRFQESRSSLVSLITQTMRESPELLSQSGLAPDEIKSVLQDEWREDRLRYGMVLSSLDEPLQYFTEALAEIRTAWATPSLKENPVFHWSLAVLLGALLGCCLGLVLARFWLRLRLPLYSPEDSAKRLKLPVLGLVRSSTT